MRQAILLCLAISSLLAANLAAADPALLRMPEVRNFISFMVQKHGFSKKNLIEIMQQAKIQPDILESTRKPYEKKPWDIYKNFFLTPDRLLAGINFWKENQATLEKAEQLYKVPANIIVAILGVETLYGKYQGNHRVIDALTTLAFFYPERSSFFTKELAEFLILCKEHHVSPTKYKGSYAGAMGKPQFMPSSYRYYAANFTGQLKKDLMNDNEAAIASIANYFHQHGWKMNEGIAQPAKISGHRYRAINTDNKKALYELKQISNAGIFPITASSAAPQKVGVIKLHGQKSEEYWLAYPNFYVITRYNSSPQYAMVVYLLSQQLKMHWANQTNKKYAYA